MSPAQKKKFPQKDCSSSTMKRVRPVPKAAPALQPPPKANKKPNATKPFVSVAIARAPSTTIGKSNGRPSASITPKRPLKQQSNSLEHGEDSDDEEFGDVTIDMGSDEEGDDDSEQEGDDEDFEDEEDFEGSGNDEQEVFPIGEDDDEKSEVNSAGREEDGSETEEDDYMPGDSLDEEELKEEDLEKVAMSNDNGAYKKKLLPEIDPVYDSDSSTEDVTNTVGNIPLEWYNDYPHIGYDLDGKKVLRPAKGDELEKFLATMDDPDTWRSVTDREGKEVVLNDEELDIIRRLQEGAIPDAGYDPYEPTVEWFTSKVEVMPLTAKPEPKRRFVPSKWEAKTIMKIVRAIREGRIVPRKTTAQKPSYYNLWTNDDKPREDHIMHIPAPKMRLPEHDESYNPPAEYLPTEKERQEWEATDREDRPRNYLPMKYSSLRSVPAYNRFIQERFERCLDLYLAPRVRKNRACIPSCYYLYSFGRILSTISHNTTTFLFYWNQQLNIDPESLIPKLPSPKDLQPFPSTLSLTFIGHTNRIRCFSIDPTGLYLLSGSDDNTLRMWEITTGRCLHTWNVDDIVHFVAWNPNRDLWCFAASVGHGRVVVISPPEACSPELAAVTDVYLRAGFAPIQGSVDGEKDKAVKWAKPTEQEEEDGYRLVIQHSQSVKQITWHRKGDYFATVAPDAQNLAVLIHQTTKHQTQSPFKKLKGLVQRALFHPIKPIFFVATQRYVRVYNLMKQELVKTLQTGVKWVSSLDIHPGGRRQCHYWELLQTVMLVRYGFVFNFV
ncbi:rRNA processing-related protein [Jimgerdemannia flammicorona]|uniref:Ribosome biogenesis protein ERB1 n=1 Tax=Jimgerdemannia flammicorona TaxID=994334 RepID=A0A433QA53_9FUNG|nr:rRNA processing-related protein [Jimgerdemannia flammicorona]